MAKEEKDETKSSEQLGFPYTSTILPASAVSELKSIDGKIEPINLVEYRDDQNEVVTPLPLYIPKKEIEDELTKQDDPKIKPQNIMQTFLKMSSVIYSMAGLGTVEESKIYREKFPSEDSSPDSLKDEINEQLPKDEQDGPDTEEGDDVFTEETIDKGMEAVSKKDKIDILLKETDTVWMFVLPGTAKEIEGDEDIQRTLQKRKKPAAETKTSMDEPPPPQRNPMTGELKLDSIGSSTSVDAEKAAEQAQKTTETKESGSGPDMKLKIGSSKKEKKEESQEPSYVKHKYDMNHRWSQTIDFPRKKKGTQTDPILCQESHAQVTSKDLLL